MILTRPLVSLDVETHAKCNPEQNRIVELGLRVDYPDGREPKRWCSLIDPGVPITASDVHGITDADVAEKPTFAKLAPNLAHGLTYCDFSGYNVRFDLRVLQAEMDRTLVKWS